MSLMRSYLLANEKYAAEFGDKASLSTSAGSSKKKLVIVTCMDSRLDPNAFLGLAEGNAIVIRNGGGLAKEALRSIIIAEQLACTREITVIHHTNCRMLSFTTPQLQGLLKEKNSDAAAEADKIDFHEFSNVEESVKENVAFLKAHPLIHKETAVTGWVYDLQTRKARRFVHSTHVDSRG